ncbi:MAG: hypothetical protein JOY83_26710, partial [Alphaproteobacteria bacterium]|nr:hypothetical protein [Alphaproteobacteria bacterium]
MRTKSILDVMMAVGGLWTAISSANAAAYTFTQIDVPGATAEAHGINDAGDIVGWFASTTGTHGFLDSGGSFTQIDAPPNPIAPNATDTMPSGINDAGQIVGTFNSISGGNHGFLYTGGSFTQFDVPGATLGTLAYGINNVGQIVGTFDYHGFLDTSGSFTQIDVPGAFFTAA